MGVTALLVTLQHGGSVLLSDVWYLTFVSTMQGAFQTGQPSEGSARSWAGVSAQEVNTDWWPTAGPRRPKWCTEAAPVRRLTRGAPTGVKGGAPGAPGRASAAKQVPAMKAGPQGGGRQRGKRRGAERGATGAEGKAVDCPVTNTAAVKQAGPVAEPGRSAHVAPGISFAGVVRAAAAAEGTGTAPRAAGPAVAASPAAKSPAPVAAMVRPLEESARMPVPQEVSAASVCCACVALRLRMRANEQQLC